MLLSAASVLVVAQSSSEISEGLMNHPVYLIFLVYLSMSLYAVCLRLYSLSLSRYSERTMASKTKEY